MVSLRTTASVIFRKYVNLYCKCLSLPHAVKPTDADFDGPLAQVKADSHSVVSSAFTPPFGEQVHQPVVALYGRAITADKGMVANAVEG